MSRNVWHNIYLISIYRPPFIGSLDCRSIICCDCDFPHSHNIIRVTFNVFFDLRLNKWLSKQSRCRWFETTSCSLWRHCNERNWNRNKDMINQENVAKNGLFKIAVILSWPQFLNLRLLPTPRLHYGVELRHEYGQVRTKYVHIYYALICFSLWLGWNVFCAVRFNFVFAVLLEYFIVSLHSPNSRYRYMHL